jgi:hypothetical protein
VVLLSQSANSALSTKLQKSFSIRLPPFPRQAAFSSEGGQQGRLPRRGTTMKFGIRTFILPALAASFKRSMHTTEPNRNQLRFRFKTPHLFLLLGLKLVLSFYTAQAM